MGCRQAIHYMSVWYDAPIYLEGKYWRMVGGSSSRGKIAMLNSSDPGSEIERITIKECDTETFKTGHTVYLTNSNGRTAYITVRPPPKNPLKVKSLQINVSDSQTGSELVVLKVSISGSGTGTLRIKWGNLGVNEYEVKEGYTKYGKVMPAGTYTICADMI